MTVADVPPSESASRRVSLLSRTGTWVLMSASGSHLPSAATTLPSASRPELMLEDSCTQPAEIATTPAAAGLSILTVYRNSKKGPFTGGCSNMAHTGTHLQAVARGPRAPLALTACQVYKVQLAPGPAHGQPLNSLSAVLASRHSWAGRAGGGGEGTPQALAAPVGPQAGEQEGEDGVGAAAAVVHVGGACRAGVGRQAALGRVRQ